MIKKKKKRVDPPRTSLNAWLDFNRHPITGYYKPLINNRGNQTMPDSDPLKFDI